MEKHKMDSKSPDSQWGPRKETSSLSGVNDWWTKGNTAAVFGKTKDDAQWIYVISDGGAWSGEGNESRLKPATLTRIFVGEEGYQGENR